jgi:glycosyltransferase involved in cell wall biosynthesis
MDDLANAVYRTAKSAIPSVLVMAHSHPKETRGGAEIAALTLFQALKSRSAQTWFLGCAGAKSESRLGATLTQPYGPDDYLYHPGAEFDYFKFANPDPNFPKALGKLVSELRPDIIHSHHFVRFGIESFSVIKRYSPNTRIVLSLHEFLAICNHHGQMVKTKTMHLCERESYSACASCFPLFRPRDFFLRKRYIQMFFEDVDLFISPSRFLAERFRDWGLPEHKLAVLENMPPTVHGQVATRASQEPTPAARPAARRGKATATSSAGTPVARTGVSAPPTPAARRGKATATSSASTPVASTGVSAPARPLRFGFFGQMSPLKGITVLIEAAKYLNKMEVRGATIEIHGDYSNQPPTFQTAVIEALAEAGQSVVYHGAYDNRDVHRLMQRMDAVVVPSTWWENSPVVIQEALANGKPVICSDIGGMAEKVVPGVNGLHFAVGQATSLAQVIMDLTDNPERLAEMTAIMRRPLTVDVALDAHLSLYRSILSK